jgi:arsenate reductase
MKVTIYHNPRCSKSRQTLALLEQSGTSPVVVEYLKTPPDHETLKKLLAKLGLGARELMRNKEAAFTELELDRDALSEDELIAAMVANPILIERPIVEAGERAVIGRPPENVKTLIG